MAQESLILFALWIAALGVAGRYGIGYAETQLWVAILAVQSVPYVAALYLSVLNTRPAVRVARTPVVEPAPAAVEALDGPDRQAA